MEIISKNVYEFPKSSPIIIPKKNMRSDSCSIYDKNNVNDKHEYYLNTSQFDPNNASPPNSWNARLTQRINSH